MPHPARHCRSGHSGIDLVHHWRAYAGEIAICTLQMVDVTTGWSARRMILRRSYIVMADALAYLFAQLPFPVLELHPTTAVKFLENVHLLAFLDREYADPQRSRSRRAVRTTTDCGGEERADDPPLGGDRRLDTVMPTRWLNTIYEKLHIYHNAFIAGPQANRPGVEAGSRRAPELR